MYKRLTKRTHSCECSIGFDYERHMIRLCKKTATWVQTESPWARVCDECKERITSESIRSSGP